jgi:hypothetical protein
MALQKLKPLVAVKEAHESLARMRRDTATAREGLKVAQEALRRASFTSGERMMSTGRMTI